MPSSGVVMGGSQLNTSSLYSLCSLIFLVVQHGSKEKDLLPLDVQKSISNSTELQYVLPDGYRNKNKIINIIFHLFLKSSESCMLDLWLCITKPKVQYLFSTSLRVEHWLAKLAIINLFRVILINDE